MGGLAIPGDHGPEDFGNPLGYGLDVLRFKLAFHRPLSPRIGPKVLEPAIHKRPTHVLFPEDQDRHLVRVIARCLPETIFEKAAYLYPVFALQGAGYLIQGPL